MSINLSGYTNVESGLFVRIDIENYRTTPGGSASNQILRFSDYYRTIVINSEDYEPLGNLVNVGTAKSEIKTSGDTMNITISGIPNSNLQEILASDIKGSFVQVWRVLFDSTTGEVLSISGNPAGRFFGYINNYNLQEELDVLELSGTNTIVFECASYFSLLNTFINGRRTNPVDQKYLYPGDTSFDRVPNLIGSNYNFGAPK